jgi:RNA-directed DNA polymerase
VFTAFIPAISRKASTAIRQTVRQWRIHRMTALEMEEIAMIVNPVIRGWINYYGRFYKTRLHSVLDHINKILNVWVRKKYKLMREGKMKATKWLRNVATKYNRLFAHWEIGVLPTRAG